MTAIKLGDEELNKRVEALSASIPENLEINRLLSDYRAPAEGEPARDRYVATVSGGAVAEALRFAIAHAKNWSPNDDRFSRRPYRSFADRINEAKSLRVVMDQEATELHRIRRIRNAFAHALEPISFDQQDVAEMTMRLHHHPVSDFDSYFAPIFSHRQKFAIVCQEFFAKLTGTLRYQVQGAVNVKKAQME